MAAASESLLASDTEMARMLAGRDALVDQLEADVEQLAERELTQAPMARDMRYLVSVMRIVPELERSGDLAEHIAQRAATGLALRLTPTVRGPGAAGHHLCRDVAGRRMPGPSATPRPSASTPSTTASTACTTSWSRSSSPTSCFPDALQATLVARFYERLGDHAVHIAERIRYLAVGT